jgi:hypothetical protein
VDQQLQALAEIRTFLVQHDIRHVVIGGIANAIWGRPRGTLDAELEEFSRALERPELIQQYQELLSHLP